MLTEERKKLILEYLESREIVKSQELTMLLNTSESTIRRDLQEMENEGLLERIHGGAKKNTKLDFEQDMFEKSTKNIQEKLKIANFASQLVKDNDVIYLDAGTSTLEMIPHLKNRNISVVTNSVQHASRLADLKIPTIIIGGNIKITTKATLGAFSLQQLKHYRFNKVFMGMNGIHFSYGYTTPDPEEAALKEAALLQTDKAFILCDHTKFNKVSFTKVTDLSVATIITDYCPPELLEEIKMKTEIKEVQK